MGQAQLYVIMLTKLLVFKTQLSLLSALPASTGDSLLLQIFSCGV